MASGSKKGKGISAVKAARAGVVSKRQIPWGTIIAVVAIVGLAAVVFGYYIVASAPKRDQAQREEIAQTFQWSQDDPDPSERIEGVESRDDLARGHVAPNERVAYDHEPPMGGPHDGTWAACNGNVYPEPVRTENLVHSLEHGAVWIAYDPEQLDDDAVDLLRMRVQGKRYTVMSPYPGIDQPISVQAWGRQLKLDDAEDERIDQFIAALRQNPTTTPEQNATCGATEFFDPDNPPPFDPAPAGDDGVPMNHGDQAGQDVSGEMDGIPGLDEIPDEEPEQE